MNFDLIKIKDLPISIIDGDRSSKYPKRDEFRTSGIPFLNSTNIKDDRIDLTNANFITQEKYQNIKKGRAFPGDIIMTTRGSIGKVARIPPAFRGLINAQMLLIRSDENIISGNYIFQLLRSDNTQTKLRNFSSGAAQPQIPIRDLQEIELPIPSLPIQRRIAAILSAYDDLIENNTRRIAILEEMARRIYEEWFVKFKFPGHEKVKMVDSELGKIPEGWRICSISQIAEVNARNISRGNELKEITYIDISSVSTSSIDKKQAMIFSEAPGRARRIVKDGDIIWSCVRPNRKSYSLVLQPESNLIVSTGFAVLSATDIPFSYLYFNTTTDDFAGYLTNRATGAAYPAVTAKDFESATILKPTKSLLYDFHCIVEPLLRFGHLLRQKNANLRTTRDFLLPKLISGEIDISSLPEPEEAAA